MTLSDFEKQRQANIARNQALLKQLNLDSISQDIYSELKKEDAPKRRRATKPVKPREIVPALPTRRSRRIAGVKLEDVTDDPFIQEVTEAERKREELERIKRMRLSGDVSLVDIITDKNGVKAEEDEALLEKFREIGKNYSMGDFFDQMVEKYATTDKALQELREEFTKVTLVPQYDPNDVKITPGRMSTVTFHPSTAKRLVVGGDVNGHIGIWSVDNGSPIEYIKDEAEEVEETEELEPDITILKNHGKNVGKIVIQPTDSTKIITSSYDGSIRSIDLNNLKSTEKYFSQIDGLALGVSDIQFGSPNVLFYTTLEGLFGRVDFRESSRKKYDLLRVHDKKIGSFSANPNRDYQIATASLDRSLRIWDLRNVKASPWSEYEGARSPHCYGGFSSRLSVSCADWNSSNKIVCNGYDDKINIIDVSDASSWSQTYVIPGVKEEVAEGIPNSIVAEHRIKHNCQTGRWVSILKSKWQQNPRDGYEKFAIGNMNRAVDVYSENGQQIAHLQSLRLTAVPAVVAWHPTENWIVGGSASGKGYLFC
ncbi:hypothetical protein BABINDRAFT_159314 [Babjeviella inositovora NRRL Y-12698]|uniref:DNA damage-binding protein CMR1 n=1 Tax=Babjeviella inositovora NRRL Y-12698 TaxID=984486 RepID=A0A1E3R0C3_9ASCO|nr:uncharacterized protein BABINDRAFT_159314 [Babjeviella inositovora NRRL Y-12698]ODQ82812.1 hypothetical protein BABINDRAFT_159314 [Babjeviella inositovora NRRL Y-12698]